jgi:moderate conductance mechanosensitive channel
MPIWLSSALNLPLVAAVLRIGLIALLALLAGRGLRQVARQVEHRLEKTVPDPERLARLNTLIHVGRGVALVLVLVIAGAMVLHSLDINIAPLLAGAGVVGLALSLGAQTLIKDYIGGILILVENQFTTGDTIKVGSVTGSVERITLRATYLRDLEGALHIVPNGDIRLVSNLTTEWARAVVDLNVDYQADMSQVIRALEDAAQKAQADDAIKDDLLEPPEALGWIGFKDWAVQVRLMAKTRPGKQWGVMIALRRYAVEALQVNGIRVALPTQQIRWETTDPVRNYASALDAGL